MTEVGLPTETGGPGVRKVGLSRLSITFEQASVPEVATLGPCKVWTLGVDAVDGFSVLSLKHEAMESCRVILDKDVPVLLRFGPSNVDPVGLNEGVLHNRQHA